MAFPERVAWCGAFIVADALAFVGSVSGQPVGYTVIDLGTLCASDCCHATFTLGCSDSVCESAICAVDPSCCDVAWHEFCALEANQICDVCEAVDECETSFFDFSSATAVNAEGRVVGFSRPSQFSSNSAAWYWENGELTALPHLPEDTGSTAEDINDAAQVMGTSILDALLIGYTAVVWEDHGDGWEVSPVFTPGVSQGAAINNSGLMTGWNASDFCPDPDHRGWRLPGGFLSSLEVGGESEALGINERGEVVGHAQTGAGSCDWPFQAVSWSASGGITNLGTLGGDYSTASAINNASQIVGDSKINDTSFERHAFRWLPEPAYGLPFGLHDLGTLGGDWNFARGINNLGWVVGQADQAPGDNRAFLWVHGVMIDLNDLIPRSSGWQLVSANDINDRGQIVGRGFLNGQDRAFLLTPVSAIPAASGYGVLVMAALLIAGGVYVFHRRADV